MFYETAQTVGPGWHRSFKPSHYEDMSWSPSGKNMRSPGASPETYRRIIRNEEDFPDRNHQPDDDEFFRSGRRSPTFPRRIFKEVWNESPNHRFGERPRLFKRVFRPNNFEEDFERDSPHLRRFEREFDRNFDDSRASTRKFDEDFDRHFSARPAKEEEESGSEGKVHHIPIVVERRMEDLKSKFGRQSPPPQDSHRDDEYSEEWSGPQVHRLRRAFEPDDGFSTRPRGPKMDGSMKSRMFANIPETWDPQAVHTLPTRKMHKTSQSFEDCRHPPPSKNVMRSNSETNEDMSKFPQQHSAAFRSHSDGHCPKQTYVTKIEVNTGGKDKADSTTGSQSPSDSLSGRGGLFAKRQNSQRTEEDSDVAKPKSRGKYDSPSLQQIASVLQNIEDLVHRIDGYSGTGRDKQYRFLDEMLTRCMLRLDDIDTEGREDVRNARKAAIREVQNCIDMLEAKAEESERSKAEKPRTDNKENLQSPEESAQNSPKTAAIPLGDVPQTSPCDSSTSAIPLQGSCNSAIPLGDSSIPVIPLADTVIPLGDVPKPAIPLSDVPSSTEKRENSSGNQGDVKDSDRNVNIEQTKL